MVSLLSLRNIWRVKCPVATKKVYFFIYCTEKKLHGNRTQHPILHNALPTGESIRAEGFLLIYTKLLHFHLCSSLNS